MQNMKNILYEKYTIILLRHCALLVSIQAVFLKIRINPLIYKRLKYKKLEVNKQW